MNILEKIRANAQEHPARIAYHYEGLDGSEELSWEALDRQSDALAAYLYGELTTKKPVVVYGHKHPLMPVCFLACVKAGCAYCPIDTSVPDARVRAIVEAVEPELVLNISDKSLTRVSVSSIVGREKARSLSDSGGRITEEQWVGAEDVYYIIFTSGSTGTPKGVQITRECLDNFIRWGMTLGSINSTSRDALVFFNTAPFSFDLSVMDLYLSLYSGGTLWAVDKEVSGNIRKLTEMMEKSGADIIVATPSFVNMCLADKRFSEEALPRLRRFLFCGETLPNTLVKRIRERFPGAEIVNTYGPTESTVAVTDVLVTDQIEHEYNPLPVGSPKPGTWISIEDADGRVLPDGEKGEIVIIGDSVSMGYYQQPELTDRSFGERVIDGVRYRSYRTGDAGYLRDGFLFYSGRIDLQIKLNGYRIELGDIENNLEKIQGVAKAVVVANYRETEVKSLTAFIVPEEDAAKDSFVEYIRQQAKSYLPEYMVPKRIRLVSAIPMTGNGKVDRKRLMEMES